MQNVYIYQLKPSAVNETVERLTEGVREREKKRGVNRRGTVAKIRRGQQTELPEELHVCSWAGSALLHSYLYKRVLVGKVSSKKKS